MNDKQSIKETMAHLNDPTMVERDETFRIQKQQAAENGDEKAQWWVKFDTEALNKEGEIYKLNREVRERNDGTWMRDLEANFHDAQNARDDFRRSDRPHSSLVDRTKAWDKQANDLEEAVMKNQEAFVVGARQGGPEANKALRDQLDERMREEQKAVENRQQYGLLPSERDVLRDRQVQNQSQEDDQENKLGFREADHAPGEGREGYEAVMRWRKEREEVRESHNSTTKHGMEGFEESSLPERMREKQMKAIQNEFQYQNGGRMPTNEEFDAIKAKQDEESERSGQKSVVSQAGQKDNQKNVGQPRIQGAMDAAAGIEKLGPMPPVERKEAQTNRVSEWRANRHSGPVQSQEQVQIRKRGESQSQ